MQTFTGFQYLLIDAANNFGLDKKLFEERIEWATDNLWNLEELVDAAPKKSRPLFAKAVMAIRKAQAKQPTGHMVGFDACCSGIQMMSVLTGCIVGATSTGMVNPNVRADAYTICTDHMNDILGGGVEVERDDAKNAVMTSFYGSKAEPKKLFGEDTPELDAFYEGAQLTAPGAWELLQDLLASWQPYALEHSWKLPDGFDANVRVLQKKEVRIEVDELDHATFSYEFYENKGTERGLSNVANMTHSVDGYVLRTMHRRCNYDLVTIQRAYGCVTRKLTERMLGAADDSICCDATNKVYYYIEQYERSTVADIVIAPYLDVTVIGLLSNDHLTGLERIMRGMLQHKPFPLITVHDEFKAHPNNVNWVRWHYKEIMADIADSELLDDLLSQINKHPGKFNKHSNNLGDLIRNSNYALS